MVVTVNMHFLCVRVGAYVHACVCGCACVCVLLIDCAWSNNQVCLCGCVLA